MMSLRGNRLAVAAGAVLLLAACGGGGSTATGSADPGVRPDLPVASASSPLPDVTVRDVTNDAWVQFADLLPAERPVLFWFWAPH
jgi:hypothetical protein